VSMPPPAYGPPPAPWPPQPGPPQGFGPPPPWPPPPPPARSNRRWLWIILSVGAVLVLAEATVAIVFFLRGSGDPGVVSPPGARYSYTAPDGWQRDYRTCRGAPPWTSTPRPLGDDQTCLHESDKHYITLYSGKLDQSVDALNAQQVTDAVRPLLVGNVAAPDFQFCGAVITRNDTDPKTLGSRIGQICLSDRLGSGQVASAQVRFSGTVAVVELCPTPGKDPALDDTCTFVWQHLRVRS
jgi:hypothetical protein